MTEPLWRPSPGRIAAANLTRFCRQVGQTGVEAADMASLYRWSIAEPEAFWRALWDFAGIVGEGPGQVGIENPGRMPGAQFFPEARLNYAENLLRRRDDAEALVFWGEDKVKRRLSYRQLYDLVSRLAQALKAAGVEPGDRVAGYRAEHAGDHRRHAGHRQPRRHLVLLLAGFRRPGRARPLRPDRAQAADHRRRLLLQRQDASIPWPASANACPSCPRVERVIVLPYLSDAPDLAALPKAVRLADFIAPYPPRPIDFARAALQPSALHHVSPRARPACRNASCTAPAARCSSI